MYMDLNEMTKFAWSSKSISFINCSPLTWEHSPTLTNVCTPVVGVWKFTLNYSLGPFSHHSPMYMLMSTCDCFESLEWQLHQYPHVVCCILNDVMTPKKSYFFPPIQGGEIQEWRSVMCVIKVQVITIYILPNSLKMKAQKWKDKCGLWAMRIWVLAWANKCTCCIWMDVPYHPHNLYSICNCWQPTTIRYKCPNSVTYLNRTFVFD